MAITNDKQAALRVVEYFRGLQGGLQKSSSWFKPSANAGIEQEEEVDEKRKKFTPLLEIFDYLWEYKMIKGNSYTKAFLNWCLVNGSNKRENSYWKQVMNWSGDVIPNHAIEKTTPSWTKIPNPTKNDLREYVSKSIAPEIPTEIPTGKDYDYKPCPVPCTWGLHDKHTVLYGLISKVGEELKKGMPYLSLKKLRQNNINYRNYYYFNIGKLNTKENKCRNHTMIH